MKTNNPQALYWKFPLEGISTRGGEITALPSEMSHLTQADIDAIEVEYETATGHIAPRQANYPSIPEQLDMIYHDMTAWQKTIKAVKDKYLKG